MDQVLKDVGLDLKFSIYNLIPFTIDDGLLQFVPNSDTITDIRKKHGGDIGNYFRAQANGSDEEYERILDNYICSCAGYCTATYLLGIGDRHLENLMIDTDGLFFHIDFGFIFGKEPGGKDFLASKIRVSKSMITVMGGIDSPNYQKFEKKFVESFLIIRSKMGYILNLVHLMINSGISDLPYETHQKVLSDMYQRFLPDQEHQQAKKMLEIIVKNCINAPGAEIIEKAHNMA